MLGVQSHQYRTTPCNEANGQPKVLVQTVCQQIHFRHEEMN